MHPPANASNYATGFHARFLVRPGAAVVRMSHSSDLSDWSDPSDSLTMPFTTNLLELDHPLAAPAFFLPLQRDAPPAPETPDLLTAPLEGTWTAPVPPQPETPVGTPVQMPAP